MNDKQANEKREKSGDIKIDDLDEAEKLTKRGW